MDAGQRGNEYQVEVGMRSLIRDRLSLEWDTIPRDLECYLVRVYLFRVSVITIGR